MDNNNNSSNIQTNPNNEPEQLDNIENKSIGICNSPNSENKQKSKNKIAIIVGSTNFYFIFNDKRETIPVLLLFRGDNKLIGTKVIEKITGHKYLDKAMIFFDFLYYLDIKNKVLKDILIKRNLFDTDLKFIDENLDKIILFNYMFLSSKVEKEDDKKKNDEDLHKGHKNDNKENKIFPSVNKPKLWSQQNEKNLNYDSYSSEELLNYYIDNFIEEKLNNLNEEYFSLQLILPLYLNDEQKAKIKNIFQTKLNEKNLNKNLIDFKVFDEMNYCLGNINKNFENKIIFIHFGGSSLVVILYDYDNKKIIKKKEKLIGGIDIDIMLTKDSLTKFKNDNNGCSIMDVSLIYKVKNEIEEKKKNYFQIIKIN